jgi:hypothetical protein
MSATENAIDEAITAHLQAEQEAGVITGWVAIVAITDHSGEDEESGVITVYPGGSMGWPMALGIVEAGRIRLHSQFAQGDQ